MKSLTVLLKFEEAKQKQIDLGKFYTADQISHFFTTSKAKMISQLADEGKEWFHPVELNSEMIGGRMGDSTWCDKFVLVIPVHGEFWSEEEINRVFNLKAFL